MFSADKIAPAILWRAFFVFWGLLNCPARAAVPASQPSELAQIGLPNAAEAQQILESFRKSGIPGKYFLEFELHGLPRRGPEVVYRGRMWGDRNAQGAITRVEVVDGAGKTSRLLVQNGPQPAIWKFVDGKTQSLGLAAAFEPLVPGLEMTAFDLQMPFLYWPNARLDRIDRVLGRPANAFIFPAPADVTAQHKTLTAVRASFDGQTNALVRIEQRSAQGLLKTISLLSFKKVGEQWIPKAFDVRNDVSRDKTRFQVTGAALNLDLPASLFTPEGLAENVTPPLGRVVTIEP